MKHVTPQIYLIAKTQVSEDGAAAWLNGLNVNYELPPHQTGGNKLITLAGKRCYMSFQLGDNNRNLTKVRTDMAEFIDNILATGHGSVTEHVNYTFAIENVSRVFTAEMNRHRAGMAVSEGSMRYIRYDDLAFWLPPSIQATEGDTEQISQAKARTREIFDRAFSQMESNYAELVALWGIDGLSSFAEKKKLTSLFRRIIGMGVATGGVWTGNIRALRHIFTMRCDPAAEEEICYVATLMLREMMTAEPDLFGDFEEINGYFQPKYRKV